MWLFSSGTDIGWVVGISIALKSTLVCLVVVQNLGLQDDSELTGGRLQLSSSAPAEEMEVAEVRMMMTSTWLEATAVEVGVKGMSPFFY